MKKSFLLLLLTILLPLSVQAQEKIKFTEKLGTPTEKGATVILHQDAEIDILVNGTNAHKNVARADSTRHPVKGVKNDGRVERTTGYRVQIFLAGNTAQDKETVKSWGRRFKNRFPDHNVYISHRSPHWVACAGDFKTRDEASELLTRMRSAGFRTACVVRSEINTLK